MTRVPIPAWTSAGLLPPTGSSATGSDRSPYKVSLVHLVQRFGSTDPRTEVLRGLLGYRAALHAAGIVSGFQWIDGSFVEDVEALEGRAPQDVDAVTFFALPLGQTPASLVGALEGLVGDAAKEAWRVDAYLVNLGSAPARIVERATYWYSMWAHRRDGTWKGFLEIDLAPDLDPEARAACAPHTEGAP